MSDLIQPLVLSDVARRDLGRLQVHPQTVEDAIALLVENPDKKIEVTTVQRNHVAAAALQSTQNASLVRWLGWTTAGSLALSLCMIFGTGNGADAKIERLNNVIAADLNGDGLSDRDILEFFSAQDEGLQYHSQENDFAIQMVRNTNPLLASRMERLYDEYRGNVDASSNSASGDSLDVRHEPVEPIPFKSTHEVK